MSDEACNSTPKAQLEREIMSANEPKNEREWWAYDEITQLRADLAAARQFLRKARAAFVEGRADFDDDLADDINAFLEESAMSDIININALKPPVVYTVTIAHHWDDTLEFCIEDVADDERSREAVMSAFRRISGAEADLAAARELLKEARPYVSHHGSERTNDLLARLDAALGKEV